jgi:hypothetical protein
VFLERADEGELSCNIIINMAEKTDFDGIPVNKDKSGLFRKIQTEMELKRRAELVSKISKWLDKAATGDEELKEMALKVRSGLENGSILLSVRDYLLDESDIAIRKGKWRLYPREGIINEYGNAVVICATDDFDPDALSANPEATVKLLQETIRADKEAGDLNSPDRIISSTLKNFRFFGDSVFAFTKDIPGQ